MWAVALSVGLGIFALLGYYIFLQLVKNNIFWGKVESGWCRIVLKWGEYVKTIGPGIHWIGIPGISSLYSRKMAFLKGVIKEDGTVTVEAHKDENITSFKTTKYPYALPFKDEEDHHGLPLSGVVVVDGRMAEVDGHADAYKMFFVASDWYATISLLVLSCLRNIITEISFEEITGRRDTGPNATTVAIKVARPIISQLLWQKMNDPREGDKRSVIAELLEIYGMDIDSVELASIDPPPDWRPITLAPYKAEKEKEAAKHQAETSAILLNDTNQALEAWKKTHANASLGEVIEKQRELADRAYLKAGGQRLAIHGLENATTAVVGGGGAGAGILVGGNSGNKPGKNPGKPKGKPGNAGNPSKPSNSLEEQANDYFRQFSKYPDWDPLKRTPN